MEQSKWRLPGTSLELQIRLDRGAVSEEFKGEIALNAKNLPKQYKNTYTWHRKKKNGGFKTELIPYGMFVESGIYRLEGDTLTLCTKNGAAERLRYFQI